VLGNLHWAQALVAVQAGDRYTAEQHLSEMERHYRPTGNPSLISQCEQLRRELGRSANAQGALSIPPGASSPTRAFGVSACSTLKACLSPAERADRALQILLQQTGGHTGFLFAFERDHLRLLSPLSGAAPPPELETELLAAIATFTADDTTAKTRPTGGSAAEPSPSPQAGPYQLIVLGAGDGASALVVGAAAIACIGKPRAPHPTLVRAIAEALLE
jgi:hypothetical protein